MNTIILSVLLFTIGTAVSYAIYHYSTKEPLLDELWIPPEKPHEIITEEDYRACVLIDDFIDRGMSIEQAHKIVLEALR